MTVDPDNLSYDSSAINGTDFTVVLKGMTPRANGADYTDAEVRPFGTNDSRGAAYEVRPIGAADYGYTHLTGGGEFSFLGVHHHPGSY